MLGTLKPPVNLGMTTLDRSKFTTSIPLLVARTEPRNIAFVNKRSTDLLHLRGIAHVIKTSEDERGILLNKSDKQELSSETLSALEDAHSQLEPYELKLGYDYWTAEEILRAVLPENLEDDVPSGFTIVGHIAHMNLRDCFLPWKHLIGQVILDKNSSVKVVVNKLQTIHNVYRNFDMEVLASEGEPNFWVEQRESGCRFQFDFRRVYWNSRLHAEHERLIEKFSPGDAVCDPFAGVGPFAIPAAKKGVLAYANDLNPDSYKALEVNVKLNKVGSFVQAFNEDGRQFIKESLKRLQSLGETVERPAKAHKGEKAKTEVINVPQTFAHYVMNLPESAIEFLDAFQGLYHGLPELKLPWIHVHCFHKWDSNKDEPTLDDVATAIAKRISVALDYPLSASALSLHDVRKVAPTKEMYCASFELPKEVAYS